MAENLERRIARLERILQRYGDPRDPANNWSYEPPYERDGRHPGGLVQIIHEEMEQEEGL